MIKLAPSLLAADFLKIGEEIERMAAAGADYLHYDVMDGNFVPNISFGVPVLKSLHKALPDAFYDVHLMIDDPLTYAEPFAKAGASLITFHLECGCDTAATLARIKALGCKTGLSVKPHTSVQALFPYLDQLDLALVMSVEPGFGGQKFMPMALDKIHALREEIDRRGLSCLVEVDGGVDAVTGPACVEAGADVLVAGSAVFGAADPAAAVAGLKAL